MKPPLRVTMIRVPTIVDASASTAPVTPPLGLAYLQRVVRGFTDNISIVDAVGERPEFRSTRLVSVDESEEENILGLAI